MEKNIIPNIDIIKYFNKMQKHINMNKISFQNFQEYFINLTTAISERLLDNYLSYALTLSRAIVLPITDENLFLEYMEALEDLIANSIRKDLEPHKNSLIEYFDNMKKAINLNFSLTFKQYCNYCEQLKLLIMAKVDYIDCLECAKYLQKAEVETTKTYSDDIKFYSLQKSLAKDIVKLEEKSTKKSRK